VTGDGQEELLFLNYNNRMSCVSLLALKSDRCFGVSPPYDGLRRPNGKPVLRGNQVACVLFPTTDVGKQDLPSGYNQPDSAGIVVHTSGVIDAHINELRGSGGVIYSLSARLSLQSILFSDEFEHRRNQLIVEPSIDTCDWAAYSLSIKDAVLYWTDSGWVSAGSLLAVEDSSR
jgi:hypothetical protein